MMMTKCFGAAAAACFAIATGGTAQAAQLPVTVSLVSGTHNGDIAVLTDGFIPALYDIWTDNTVWTDYGSPSYAFAFDFGGTVTVDHFLLSLDNNDDYALAFFDGATYTGGYSVTAGEGEVSFGMDVFTTVAPVPAGSTLLAFSSVIATRAVLTSANGDGAYGIGEVQFFNSAAVPEPASWAMLIAGFALAGGTMRARRRPVSATFA
jgi:hypothetical protein